MQCVVCKSEVTQIVSLMIEYLHIRSEREDIVNESTTTVSSYNLTKIHNYCNLLETFTDAVDNLSDLIDNIRSIDITGKTYAQVRQELSIVLKKWKFNTV